MSIAQKMVVGSSVGLVSYGCYRCYDNFMTKYQTDRKFNENINNLNCRIKSFSQRTVENCPIYNYDYTRLYKKWELENNDTSLLEDDTTENEIVSELDESQKLLEIIT